jgi:hypothetical protein
MILNTGIEAEILLPLAESTLAHPVQFYLLETVSKLVAR